MKKHDVHAAILDFTSRFWFHQAILCAVFVILNEDKFLDVNNNINEDQDVDNDWEAPTETCLISWPLLVKIESDSMTEHVIWSYPFHIILK